MTSRFIVLIWIWFAVTGISVGPTAASERGIEAAAWEDEQVRTSLQEALAQPEYLHLRRENAASKLDMSWLERLLERWLGDDESEARSTSGGLDLPDLSTVIVLTIIVAVILALAAWAGRRRPKANRPALPAADAISELSDLAPGDQLVREWLDRARTLAASGNPAAAIRCLLFGGMSWTEEHGFVRHRPGLTNRSYIRALRNQPQQGRALREIADVFELVYFGHRQANVELYNGCLDTFRKGFLHGDGSPQISTR